MSLLIPISITLWELEVMDRMPIFSKYPIKSVSNISKNELINFYCIDYNSLPISIVNCHLESNNIGQLLQASKTKLVFLSSQKYITQSYNKLK